MTNENQASPYQSELLKNPQETEKFKKIKEGLVALRGRLSFSHMQRHLIMIVLKTFEVVIEEAERNSSADTDKKDIILGRMTVCLALLTNFDLNKDVTDVRKQLFALSLTSLSDDQLKMLTHGMSELSKKVNNDLGYNANDISDAENTHTSYASALSTLHQWSNVLLGLACDEEKLDEAIIESYDVN